MLKKLKKWGNGVWLAVLGIRIISTTPLGSGTGESSNGIGEQGREGGGPENSPSGFGAEGDGLDLNRKEAIKYIENRAYLSQWAKDQLIKAIQWATTAQQIESLKIRDI